MSSLLDAAIRNQILLERLKTGAVKDFQPTLRELDKLYRDTMLDAGDVIGTKRELNQLLTDLRKEQVSIYADYNNALLAEVEELAIDQAEYELESLSKYVVNTTPRLPANQNVLGALRANPMQIQNYTGSPLLSPFIRDFTDSQINMVQTRIRQGYSQGQTTAQIARSIRGTKKNNYRDGDLARVNRSNRALVHTVLQHASTQGRLATMSGNSDIVTGYQWVSTLDGHTSQICRSLDGNVYDIGQGPLPPIHVACRSTIVDVINPKFDLLAGVEGDRPSSGAGGAKIVGANTTYYAWLRRQPASFQDSAIGKTRGRLLRNGGLTSDEFAALNLNKNFEPLTLSEMRTLRPEVFEAANL